MPNQLVTPIRPLASFLAKEAASPVGNVPDDVEKWPAHVLSELQRVFPFLGKYDVAVNIDKVDAEVGYGAGYAMIRNFSARNLPQTDVVALRNYVRIPIIIQERKLLRPKSFELGGEFFALNKQRIGQAMSSTQIFDGAENPAKLNTSLFDDMFPPYQARNGTGRIYDGKIASAQDMLDVAAAGRAKIAELQKSASYLSTSVGGPYFGDKEWIEQFYNTPFFDEAQQVLVSDAENGVEAARRRVADVGEGIADALLDVEGAELSAKLASYKGSTGVPENETLAKLSSLSWSSPSGWVGEFAGTPFEEEALGYRAKVAQRRVERETRDSSRQSDESYRARRLLSTTLEAKLAAWKYEQATGREFVPAVKNAGMSPALMRAGVGAGVGAVAGAVTASPENRTKRTLQGAMLGGAVGAASTMLPSGGAGGAAAAPPQPPMRATPPGRAPVPAHQPAPAPAPVAAAPAASLRPTPRGDMAEMMSNMSRRPGMEHLASAKLGGYAPSDALRAATQQAHDESTATAGRRMLGGAALGGAAGALGGAAAGLRRPSDVLVNGGVGAMLGGGIGAALSPRPHDILRQKYNTYIDQINEQGNVDKINGLMATHVRQKYPHLQNHEAPLSQVSDDEWEHAYQTGHNDPHFQAIYERNFGPGTPYVRPEPDAPKTASLAAGLAGGAAGYAAGRRLAGDVGSETAPRGKKERSGNVARSLAVPTTVAGGIGGYLLAKKHKGKFTRTLREHLPDLDEAERGTARDLYHAGGAFLGAGAAGALTGLAVGGLARLKGRFDGTTEKDGFLPGPMAELGGLGIPSAVGYVAGRSPAMTGEHSAEEESRKYSLLGGAFVPGYTGYHFGRKAGGRAAAEKDGEKARKMLAELTATEAAAARANLPSPGKMLLLTQSGNVITQVTTAGIPQEQKTAAMPQFGPPGATLEGSSLAARALHGVRNAGRAYWDVASGGETRRTGARAAGAQRAVQMMVDRADMLEEAGPGAASLGPHAVDQLQDFISGPWLDAQKEHDGAKIRRASSILTPLSMGLEAGRPLLAHAMGPYSDEQDEEDRDARLRAAPLTAAIRGGLTGAMMPIHPLGAGGSALLGAGVGASGGLLARHLHLRQAQEKGAMGLGGMAGAAGGVNAGSGHGVLSAGLGGLVGSLVGEYVLPMVERALLAAGPEFAQVAKPAALLASGLAGEISGRLIGNILQPKAQEIQERNHERA